MLQLSHKRRLLTCLLCTVGVFITPSKLRQPTESFNIFRTSRERNQKYTQKTLGVSLNWTKDISSMISLHIKVSKLFRLLLFLCILISRIRKLSFRWKIKIIYRKGDELYWGPVPSQIRQEINNTLKNEKLQRRLSWRPETNVFQQRDRIKQSTEQLL